MQVDVEPVQVLKEVLHPADHDLVVAPSQLQLGEQGRFSLTDQEGHHLIIQVLLDGLSVPFV